MTKFITYYNLCPLHDTNEFLGLSPDCDNGNIIATLGRNIAMVIKISTQKQIRSWSVLEKFSCKVVYDPKSQQYVGVFANRFVRQWDDTISDINKCKKLKFHKNIADLVYDSYETLLVYADGTCESLSSAIQSRKEYKGDNLQMEMFSPNTIIDPKIMRTPDGRRFFTYFTKNNTDTIELLKVELNSSNLKPISDAASFILRRAGQDVAVAGYSVIEAEDSHALLTIWADGRVFLLNLVDNLDSRNSPGQFVSMFTDLKVDTPLTIIGLSKHCVAIYGGNSTQEGGSLVIYNTQFKVVKAKQFFKIYFNYSRLWSVGSNILLAMGQNLSVVSYQVSKGMLCDLVGSQISNDFSHTVEAEFVNEEEELEEHLQLAEGQKPPPGHLQNGTRTKDENKTKKEEAIFADGKSIPFKGADGFYNKLNRLMNRDIHVEIVQVESAHADFDINLMSNYYDTGFVTEEVQIIAKQLEQSGASEHEITEKLLWVLIKADLVEDIAVCLRRYTSISERILVKTLKYVLQDFEMSPAERALENSTTNSSNHMDVDIDKSDDGSDFPNVDLLADSCVNEIKPVKERKDLMNVVLSCSFDIKSISAHISKEIEYNDVLKMLEYLHVLITSKQTCLEERPNCPDKIEEDLRILRWFGVFLNTHFQKMTLSKDLRLCEILMKWHLVFTAYKSQISELEHVAALLYNIVDKKQISKENNYSKWYSIEEVRLY